MGTWLAVRSVVRVSVLLVPEYLFSSTTVSRSEGLIPSAKDEFGWVGVGVSGDFVQLSLNHIAEFVKIQVVEVVVERVFDFGTDFEEPKIQKRREGGSRNCKPAKGLYNLERKSQKIYPDRHTEMCLICEGKGSIRDTFKVAEGVLNAVDTANECTGNRR